MVHALADDGADVVVVEEIIDGLAFPAAAHEARLLEKPQLV